MLLGIGGVRAIRAFCALTGHPAPEVFHTNEGHAGFLGLERIRELTEAGLGFDAAVEMVRAGTVFTTHTPVPAGIDRFPRELVEQYFGGDNAVPTVPVDAILGPGRGDVRGRRPGRVQHGRHGPAAGPAGERRRAAARRREPADVQRPVAGVRRRRGADHVGHQRRARADLGGARGHRPGPAHGRPRAGRRGPRLGVHRARRRPRDLGRAQRCCARGWSRSPGGGCGPPGCSAGRARPSWAGSTTSSTRACSPSGSRAGCRRTSGSRSCCATRSG